MLLTITYTGQNTTDLGYLLHKNPYRPQVFELNHGRAFVFYPEVSDARTTAALLLDIDPIDLARGKVGSSGGGLFDYVNDRPYVSSSFLSTAISRVYGTAITGRADRHQALSDSALNLTAAITMLPCRGDTQMLRRVFEPLGYEVAYETFLADEMFPEWGASSYVNLTIRAKVRLRDLLKHLNVLIPVFDRQKHYWVGADEVDKLLRLGEGWLADHPERDYITGRYLNRSRSLVNQAFDRLSTVDQSGGEVLSAEPDFAADAPAAAELPATTATPDSAAERKERKPSLNTLRLESVAAALKESGAKRVIDLGCGEGNLLRLLLQNRQFTQITGVDVSHLALKRAHSRLRLDRASDSVRERIQLIQGSLTYRDSRFGSYDAAAVVEVIEHLDPSRLAAFERVLFEFAKPLTIVLTTPNKEYNSVYELGLDSSQPEEELRHSDHRFEWTRVEFRQWAEATAAKHGYEVQFQGIGDTDPTYGTPTQMGVFSLCE